MSDYRRDDTTCDGNGFLALLDGDGEALDWVSSANHGYAPGLGLAVIPTGFDNQLIAIRIVDY